MLNILRSRRWVAGRRLVLVAIVLILAARQYGDALVAWLRGPDPATDIIVMRAEFRPAVLAGTKPAWIIGLRNTSSKYTYDQIQLEAVYLDKDGNLLETDKLVVRQKLPPGDERLVGSLDFKQRPAASSGTLKVVGAEEARQ
jgi:hypothetical protein